MRRLEPQAALALPPIASVDLLDQSGAWTLTERKPIVGYAAAKKRKPGSPGSKASRPTSSPRRKGPGASGEPFVRSETSKAPQSARGVAGERQDPSSTQIQTQLSATMSMAPPPPARQFGGDVGPSSSEAPGGGGAAGPMNAVKGRAIERWLNHALGQAATNQHTKPLAATETEGAVASTTAKQNHGLALFGIDGAALEKIGLDNASAERVYRAMFVYSQGLHAVLQEAVGRAKSSPQALLILWRAFTTVLEHAGEGEQAETLSALVQRGNEVERQRVESQYQEKISGLQAQVEKLALDRRSNQEEVQRFHEDEMRLRNESEMYRNEHEVVMKKYEQEVKQRIDAEARFLDKTREAENLDNALNKEQQRSKELTGQLHQETSDRKAAQLELESLRTQMKILDAKATSLQQSLEEARQQKQRHEQQVSQLRQQLDRVNQKNFELKEQLEHETERVKQFTEQHSSQQRELRKLERQCEDDEHMRRELQNERDLLRDKLERQDKDVLELSEERRTLQKQLNDLNMEHRTNLIELRRKTDHLKKAESGLEKLGKEHRELLDDHRALSVEVENLREDVVHYDEQVSKEGNLRKRLQQDNKQLLGQFQVIQVQLDNTKMAVASTQKELQEVTETKVKLESIVRDTKSAMQKLTLEHQVELRAHAMKVSMLEKIIADERNERKSLVLETQDVTAKREQELKTLKAKDIDIRDLKRQRLEKEEEVARLKVLLRAQEQRNSEQLVTVDKHHSAVANHDSETRQMQVLLESERAEAKRQLREMSDACAAAEFSLSRKIEYWKMCFEDTLSQLNFNPATAKMQAMETQIGQMVQELSDAKASIQKEAAKVAELESILERRQAKIDEMDVSLKQAMKEREDLGKQCSEFKQDYERQALARNDAEEACNRIRKNTETFDNLKKELEAKLQDLQEQNKALLTSVNKPMADGETQVMIFTSATAVQTDLSYQYLEKTDSLNADRWRRERLANLKKASNFYEDPEEERDFTATVRTSSMPVAQLGHVVDLQLGEGGAKTQPMVRYAKPSRDEGATLPRSSTLAGPQAPQPWPANARPPGEKPPAKKGWAVVRSSGNKPRQTQLPRGMSHAEMQQQDPDMGSTALSPWSG